MKRVMLAMHNSNIDNIKYRIVISIIKNRIENLTHKFIDYIRTGIFSPGIFLTSAKVLLTRKGY
jgi:hypothetical protein